MNLEIFNLARLGAPTG